MLRPPSARRSPVAFAFIFIFPMMCHLYRRRRRRLPSTPPTLSPLVIKMIKLLSQRTAPRRCRADLARRCLPPDQVILLLPLPPTQSASAGVRRRPRGYPSQAHRRTPFERLDRTHLVATCLLGIFEPYPNETLAHRSAFQPDCYAPIAAPSRIPSAMV